MLNRICVLALLTISIPIFLINVNKPFVGHHDFNGAFFSAIARTLTRNNIENTKLGLATDLGGGENSTLSFYTHNVPLHPWLIAISFKFFGIGEWQARIISVFFSTLSAILIFLIAKKFLPAVAAFSAALFFSLSAMTIYFSSNVFPEPMAIAFSLCAFYFYVSWFTSGKSINFWLMFTLTLISLLVVWGSYFLPLFIVCHYLIFHPKRKLKEISIYALLPLLIFSLYIIHVKLITGSPNGGNLLEALLFRLNVNSEGSIYSFSIPQFVVKEASLINAYYSKTTMLITALWFLQLFINLKQKNKKNIRASLFILVLFFWGISYPAVFTNASFIHDYFLIYLSPFIALSTAHTIYIALSFVKIKKRLITALSMTTFFILPTLQLLQVEAFANELIRSQASKPGLILGNYLHSQTPQDKKILIASSDFGAYHEVFTNFYADRLLYYVDLGENDEDLISSYDYVVLVKGRYVNEKIKKYLSENFTFKIYDDFYVYEIKQKP